MSTCRRVASVSATACLQVQLFEVWGGVVALWDRCQSTGDQDSLCFEQYITRLTHAPVEPFRLSLNVCRMDDFPTFNQGVLDGVYELGQTVRSAHRPLGEV